MSEPQQIINVGEVANDGTGESLRQAFNAVNNNFANVWAQGPVDTQVIISNNRVSTNETNLDLELAGNGIGNIAVASTTVPTIDSVYDLGSPSRYFDTTYSRYFYGNGRFLTGISGGSGGSATVTFASSPPHTSNIGDIWIQSTTGTQYLYFSDGTSNQWAEMEAYQSFSYNAGGNSDTGNIGFVGDAIYDLNGVIIENADLSHGATAAIIVPANGNTNPIQVNNIYGNIVLQAGANSDITASWNFGNNGNLTLPGNTSNINYANGVSILQNFNPGTISTTGNITGGNLIATSNIYIGNTVFTRTLTVGRATSPVTVPLSSNNSLNVLTQGGNVVVYTT